MSEAPESWSITWWEYTGDYSPFKEGVSSPIMRNMATSELSLSCELPFGACFNVNVNASTFQKTNVYTNGPDGLAIACVTPRTSPAVKGKSTWWLLDSRASSCDKPTDDIHRCWVRHGTVGNLKLHVDKSGNTCTAGGGSIRSGAWHGFLHHGRLYKTG